MRPGAQPPAERRRYAACGRALSTRSNNIRPGPGPRTLRSAGDAGRRRWPRRMSRAGRDASHDQHVPRHGSHGVISGTARTRPATQLGRAGPANRAGVGRTAAARPRRRESRSESAAASIEWRRCDAPAAHTAPGGRRWSIGAAGLGRAARSARVRSRVPARRPDRHATRGRRRHGAERPAPPAATLSTPRRLQAIEDTQLLKIGYQSK